MILEESDEARETDENILDKPDEKTDEHVNIKENDIFEENKGPTRATARGLSELVKQDQSNYILLYGSAPQFGVKADTKLIQDVMNCFL